ncbi:hypothetical protein [Erwinia endophytica]|uniref:hypothetical protein n=1 Tax=Erwinia endophytica TaxID=1563158 RepID=UPI00186BA94B|nr:hypothetical protein [Erwinia endophytica]
MTITEEELEHIMNRQRIVEISNGAAVIMGEKEKLAKTALHYIEENTDSIKAFQEIALNLLKAQDHIDAQAAQIAELESRYAEVSGWYAKIKTRMLEAEKELAALREQEPVYWQFMSVNGDWLGIGESGKDQAVKEGCEVRPLFSQPVPPAPVAVPDEMNFSDAVNFVHINGMPCEDRPTLVSEDYSELLRLREDVKGPEGFDTWKDAAIAERIARVSLERKVVNSKHGIDYLTAMGAFNSNQWHKMDPITGYMHGYNQAIADKSLICKEFVVKLPKRHSPEGYHIDEAYLVEDDEGNWLDRDEVIEAIKAAGGSVEDE